MRLIPTPLPLLLAAGLVGGILQAQQTPLSGPVVAYAFDAPTASFRAILGWLGSSSLGPALLPGIEFGSVAPRRNDGIAVRNGKGLLVAGLGTDRASTVELAGAFSLPEGAAWADDGSAVALYSRTGNWIQIVRGFPDAPQADSPLSVSPLGGSIVVAALSPRAERTVLGIVGETSGVFELTASQNFVPLLALLKPVSLAFSGDGGTLFALDRERREVSALNWQDRTAQVWPVTSLADPVALRAVPDHALPNPGPDVGAGAVLRSINLQWLTVIQF